MVAGREGRKEQKEGGRKGGGSINRTTEGGKVRGG